MNISEAITQGVARATAPPSAVPKRRRLEETSTSTVPATPPAPPPKAQAVTDAFVARRLANVRASSRLKIDEGSQRVVAEILNSSDEVIRQVPAEELLRIAARLRTVIGKLFDRSV